MSKVLAVGDIHTKQWIIDLVEEIVNEYDRVIFVGDYADDWETGAVRSITTWEKLKSFQEKYSDKVICIKGNHDYIYAHKTSSIQSGYNTITQLMLDVPENKEIKDWIRGLPVTYSTDDIIYSHGGLVDEWLEMYNGEETTESLWMPLSPLWVRPQDGYTYTSNQVFGHTPSETCHDVGDNAWGIDTFSTAPDGTLIGDQSVLEIIDGKIFKTKILKNDNTNTSDLKT